MSEKHHNPNCVSDSYFLTLLLLCVLCIPLCCCPATRLHEVTGHKEGDTEDEWGASPVCGAGVVEGVVGPINLPELVCESLRDSVSQAAVRGHL